MMLVLVLVFFIVVYPFVKCYFFNNRNITKNPPLCNGGLCKFLVTEAGLHKINHHFHNIFLSCSKETEVSISIRRLFSFIKIVSFSNLFRRPINFSKTARFGDYASTKKPLKCGFFSMLLRPNGLSRLFHNIFYHLHISSIYLISSSVRLKYLYNRSLVHGEV